MRYPRVAIIILNWNGFEDTTECLDSVFRVDYSNFKVVVVDNGSENNEGKRLKKQFGEKAFFILNDRNLGFSGGVNMAIDEILKDCDTKYILTLNNDTIVKPEIIKEAVVVAEQNSRVGMVAIKAQIYDKPDQPNSWGLLFTISGLAFNIKKQDQKLFCPSGGAALYSRKLIKHALNVDGHFFDPDFFIYAEDVDLGFRARLYGFEAGQTIKPLVLHKVSAATGALSGMAVYHTLRNMIWVALKNYPLTWFFKYGWQIEIAWLGMVFASLLRGKPLLPWRSFFSALRGLPKMLRRRCVIQKSKKISDKKLAKAMTKKIIPWEYWRSETRH